MDNVHEEQEIAYDVQMSQAEADRLISLEKMCIKKTKYTYPLQGNSVEIPLLSIDKKESFKLTIYRGKFCMYKTTNQLREKSTNLILVRIDIGDNNMKHTNPDGEIITGNHIHIYKEGYGDKIAQPLPDIFTNPGNPFTTLREFMKYCNITKEPLFTDGENNE